MAAITVQSPPALADPMSMGSMMLDTSDSQLFGIDFLEPPNIHQSSHMSASAPGTGLLNFSLHQESLENLLYGSVDISQGQNDWYPSTTQITQDCQFCVPDHLLFSMLCLAYQHDQDPDRIDQEGSGFSHLEIKYDLPSPKDQWTAPSAAEWAHNKLVSITPGPPVQYPDAIRYFLSDKSEDLSSFPPFDPYGAINITYFLVSSAQKISGWCTMTGMISTERLEPLQKSLDTLGPIACSGSKQLVSSALCEATWQSAMIEVRMWSPSHTGGIVGGTMDAVLQQLTYLAPSCELLCETSTAKGIKSHIAWFLAYLDAPVVPDSEAPWVVLYAYKAFMIAWQLIQGTTLGLMRNVGIEDGDTEGALEWARMVFGRRQRWQLGKIIMKCLDTL
ncbi:hypothetical protein FGRMN_6635 [Fusarium graminum]|nr:hypothetical protein FGRMN_6635 [Fusarium graminum]